MHKTFYMTILCRYLGWDVSQETFYIKSVQNKETSLERQVKTFCFSCLVVLVLVIF